MNSIMDKNEFKLPVVKEKREVYLDHAAGTLMRQEVIDAMLPYFNSKFGNPSALYAAGRDAKLALANARNSIAKNLNALSGEIIFTGSGTESDNLALFGIAKKYKDRGNRIIVSAFEHHAILSGGRELRKEGFDVVELPVGNDGIIDPQKLKSALTKDTIFISIMYANNEIGVIQDIFALSKVVRDFKKQLGRTQSDAPFFHTDACHACGYLDIDVKKLGVDLMTINAGKIYGPKGVGALYVKNGVKIQPLIFGGGQENKIRSGTENIPSIIGFARALELAQKERESESARLTKLRDYMINELFARIPKIVLNGHSTKRLPNNINVSILDIEGEAILLYLDDYKISVSTGSACDSQSLEPSHVILALGRPYEFAHGSIRFTFGKSTTKDDIDYVLEIFPQVCIALRKISPIDINLNSK